MKHLTKTLANTAGALAVSALSHAAPVINWDVTASGTWTAFTSSAGAGAGVQNPDPLTLQWGTSTGSGQSSLVINNPAGPRQIFRHGTGWHSSCRLHRPKHCTDTLEQPHHRKNVDECGVDGCCDVEANEPLLAPICLCQTSTTPSGSLKRRTPLLAQPQVLREFHATTSLCWLMAFSMSPSNTTVRRTL